MNALAPKILRPPPRRLDESFGELLSLAKPPAKLISWSALAGVTEVMKAFVERIPSLAPNFVLIDSEEGSLRSVPLGP